MDTMRANVSQLENPIPYKFILRIQVPFVGHRRGQILRYQGLLNVRSLKCLGVRPPRREPEAARRSRKRERGNPRLLQTGEWRGLDIDCAGHNPHGEKSGLNSIDELVEHPSSGAYHKTVA